MATTYSTSLKLALIGDGDQAGIWGQTTNTNLGTLLEQAITGVQSITMVDANYTLTNFNGVTNEARNAVLVVTGTNNAVRDLIPPVVEKLYTIVNNTAGGYAIRVIGGSGTGVNIPNGATCLVYCDGTNFVNGLSGTAGAFSINGAITYGGVTLSNSVTGTGSMALSASPTFTGTPAAPTAAPGTNTTQIATTAFVTAATGTLGTMSTQNANNVAITGGTLNNVVIGGSTANAITGTTITASTQFSGPGTGLTGTASSLTVGTATNATNATNASNATGTLANQVAKAWARFSLTGGVVTINDSFNISTITRTGVGQVTFVFTNALSNTNYVPIGSGANTGNGVIIFTPFNNGSGTLTAPTTTQFVGAYNFSQTGGGTADAVYCTVVVFGS